VIDQLRLDRFCGHEIFPVTAVKVYVANEDDGRFLNLEIRSGQAIEQSVPDDEKMRKPSLEVWIPIPTTTLAALVGTTIAVPWSTHEAHDFWNYLCCYEQEDLRDIVVEFLEAQGNRRRARISATTRDPNHYDGSKSNTKVNTEFWFTLADE
jgi:hypothetical protein